ncbi:hypothetical protein PMIN03_008374 [Paraphaeosphaeria minitans]
MAAAPGAAFASSLWDCLNFGGIDTYLPTYLPTRLPTYVSTYLRFYVSTYLPTNPSTHQPTHLQPTASLATKASMNTVGSATDRELEAVACGLLTTSEE